MDMGMDMGRTMEEIEALVRELPNVQLQLEGLTQPTRTALDTIFILQKTFTSIFHDVPLCDNPEKLTHWAQEHLKCMCDEICEIRRELPWKYWRPDQHKVVFLPKIKEEIIDLFHFFINLCLIFGIDSKELYLEYLHKQQVNRERIRKGVLG